MQPWVLIGASCRAAAECLKAIGIESECYDRFADRDTRLLADCKRIDQDLQASDLGPARRIVLPCGGLENQLNLWHELQRHHCLLGPTVEQVKRLRDPFYLADRCLRFGRRLRFPSLANKRLETKTDDQWLVKSRASAGGLRVARFVDDGSEPPTDCYFQRHVVGQAFGVVCVRDSDATRIVHVSQQLNAGTEDGLPEFLYRGSIDCNSFNRTIEDRIAVFVDLLCSELGYRGILQADFLIDPSGEVYLLEFNPRWTSAMELAELASPGSLLTSFAELAGEEVGPILNRFDNPTESAHWYFSKRVIYATEDLQIDEAISDRMMSHRGWETIGTSLYWRLADIPMFEQTIDRGSPVCTLIAKSESLQILGSEEPDGLCRATNNASYFFGQS